jgi:hypothetical protein
MVIRVRYDVADVQRQLKAGAVCLLTMFTPAVYYVLLRKIYHLLIERHYVKT